MGRPRSNRIECFMVDGNLRQNPKFIRFKRFLDVSEEKAFTVLLAFFSFVSQNCAITACLNGEDKEVMAELCYSSDADRLIDALTKSGFINGDGEIINWFQNQPFASRKLHDQQNYESSREFPSRKSTETGDGAQLPKGNSRKLGVEKSREEKEKRRGKKSADAAPSPTAAAFLQAWHKLHADFPTVPDVTVPLSTTRLASLEERLKEPAFKSTEIIEKIRNSTYLKTPRPEGKHKGWRVTFDFITQSKTNYMKVLEGHYDDPQDPQDPQPEFHPFLCPDCKKQLNFPDSTFIPISCKYCGWTRQTTQNPQQLAEIIRELKL